MSAPHTIDSAVSAATKLLRKSKRDRLGDFASDEKAVTFAIALDMLRESLGNMSLNGDRPMLKLYINSLSADLFPLVYPDNNHSSHSIDEVTFAICQSEVMAEALMWRYGYNYQAALDNRYALMMDIYRQSMEVMYMRLLNVLSYPEFYDYFHAGMWDIATIRDFVAAGIDVELASQVFAGTR